jgi:uncharacterized protein YecE (DUF72 family)
MAIDAPSLGPVAQLSGARVLVGTCSWTDKTLVEETSWYPRRSMSAADRLAFYARNFPVAEADSTYYFPPTRELTRRWAERTPPGFTMNVKAYSLLTGHPTKPSSLWPDLRETLPPDVREKRAVYAHHLDTEALEEAFARFDEALDPLADAGKLGAVLVQYPEWFTPKRANREELERLRRRLGGRRVAVELRAPSWWVEPDDLDRTLGLLRDLAFATVVVDAPAVSRLPAVTVATSPELAVVRFHGRADDTWKSHASSAAERFRYLYGRDELGAWVPRIGELAAQAAEVHLLMNNCYQDYGVRNAHDLYEMLEPGSG